MRKRMLRQTALFIAQLGIDPLSVDVFVFRSRCGDQFTALRFSDNGTKLHVKRSERARFTRPTAGEGAALAKPAQFSTLCAKIDWRALDHAWWPGVSMA